MRGISVSDEKISTAFSHYSQDCPIYWATLQVTAAMEEYSVQLD